MELYVVIAIIIAGLALKTWAEWKSGTVSDDSGSQSGPHEDFVYPAPPVYPSHAVERTPEAITNEPPPQVTQPRVRDPFPLRTFRADVKLSSGSTQEVQVQADNSWKAKLLLEAQFGKGSIFGTIKEDW